MCPDRAMLSVYLDNELPSPWKEKMAVHVADCPACQAQLDRYRRLSQALNAEAARPVVASTAQERAWRALGERRPVAQIAPQTAARGLWCRSVTIPIPAAAAAAALFAFTLGFAWISRSAIRNGPEEQPEPPLSAAGIDLDTPGIMPFSDMNSVLQYLSSEDNGDTMILRLPESKSFTSIGEPAIIKAADYPRRYQSP